MSDYDFSMFTRGDLMKLCHQRSSDPTVAMQARLETVADGPEFEALRAEITTFVMAEIEETFAAIRPVFDKIKPKSLADIGCGYAFIDLLIYRATGCRLTLIDIEETERIYFRYHPEGAGYSNLSVARAFLEANGVPTAKITTLNPKSGDLSGLPPVDMAMSLLSCGFHYPVATYMDFIRSHVGKGVVMDLRRRAPEGRALLEEWGTTRTLHRGIKHDSVVALRW